MSMRSPTIKQNEEIQIMMNMIGPCSDVFKPPCASRMIQMEALVIVHG